MTDAQYVAPGRSFAVREFLRKFDEVCNKFNVTLVPNPADKDMINIVDNDTDEIVGGFY